MRKMIYTELTKKAMLTAYNAHHGQYDKAGVPYICHPLHIAGQMKDEVTTCVALLHDILEDTNVTLDMLEKEFPKEVTEAVVLLTHEKVVTYEEYLRRVKENPIACQVKVADINHNSDESRLSGLDITEEKREYFRNKYKKAREILE